MLYVGGHGSCQYYTFEISSFSYEILQRVLVRDSDDILLDNGTFIKLTGHVVAGGTDYLDPSLKCLPVRVPTGKRRKERMMNIDDPAGKSIDKL